MQKDDHLQQCRILIEQRLGWGSSDHWQSQDFEALSERIFAQTQVALSTTTLKRVWGKVAYNSLPSATTLNTLALFLGYTHWRDFQQHHTAITAAPAVAEPLNGQLQKARPFFHSGWLLPAAGVLALLLLAGWVYRRTVHRSSTLPAAVYTFSSQPLARGIPNSVIFNYDATAASGDSVFIQQSWDPRRRFRVPKEGHTYTSIYYYPGFFKAKLVVDNKVVKEHNLLIPSGGWLAAVDEQPVPVYFSKKECISHGMLQIPVALMESRHIYLQPDTPELRYYNIGDFKGLQNDNFIFETTLKSDYSKGSAVCQQVTVVIHCENAAIMIPLAIPGCVGDMSLGVVDTGFTAQQANLSGFGCDMNNWVHLRCEARNKQLRIWVNGHEAFMYTFSAEANKIAGISYRFKGAGSVDAVKFTRLDGSVVFEDNF